MICYYQILFKIGIMYFGLSVDLAPHFIGSVRNPISYTPSVFRIGVADISCVCGSVYIDYYSVSYTRNTFRSGAVVTVVLPVAAANVVSGGAIIVVTVIVATGPRHCY